MTLVDSSVWIDFLRAKVTPETDFLKTWLGRETLATGDLIVTEVLQGCTNERNFRIAHDLLTSLPMLRIADAASAVEAARHFRTLRGLGITVRGTIDTLIATRCIADKIALLYSDRDFSPFVEHLGLVSALHRPQEGRPS